MRAFLVSRTDLLGRAIARSFRQAGIDTKSIPLEGLVARLESVAVDALLLEWSTTIETLVIGVRSAGLAVPILVYTESTPSHQARAALFASGADQVLVAMDPAYAMDELVARARALVRRSSRTVTLRMVVGDIELDPAHRRALVRGRPVDITPSEFRVLSCLAASAPRAVSKGELSCAFSYSTFQDTHALKQLIHRLRRKLGAASDSIVAVAGFGYRLRGRDETLRLAQ